MKPNAIAHTITALAIIASSIVNAEQTNTIASHKLPSSPVYNKHTKNLTHSELLMCLTTPDAYEQSVLNQSSAKVDKLPSVSLEYLNDAVKTAYNTMRDRVFKHVTMKVTMSLLHFSMDALAPENIARYISNGTQAFLPFKFANNVKITQVTSRGRTIIYRTEMPITKNHSDAISLALAGRISTTATVCHDAKMVDDLLERNISFQYDYYDSNGDFFSSFNING